MTGQHPQLLKQWVLNPPAPSEEIRLPRQQPEESAVGQGFEVALGQFWLNPDTHKWVRWDERYLGVFIVLSAVIYLRCRSTSRIKIGLLV
jgi:hypothetical protein